MKENREPKKAQPPAIRKVGKKDQILTLYKAGITEVNDLAAITQSRPSYVAGVLEGAEHAPGYFDLYTSTAKPMNVYSKFFAGKLGFRNETTARESVGLIDELYRQFGLAGDRAGQHHALLMALTMFDRRAGPARKRRPTYFVSGCASGWTSGARRVGRRHAGGSTVNPMPRIISLIASATEIVCALGFEGQLVGRSHECDYPESVRRLPVCTAPKFDVEGTSCEIDRASRRWCGSPVGLPRGRQRLRELEPDVIVTQSQCDVCAVSLRDVERAVCSWLSACPRLVSLQPNALADVWTDIGHVAEALDARERGEELIRSLRGRMSALRGGGSAAVAADRGLCRVDRPTHGGGKLDAGTGRNGRRRQPLRRGRQALALDDVGRIGRSRPGRDPGAAVRLRHRPVAARHGRPDGTSGVAATACGARAASSWRTATNISTGRVRGS